jgi:hypothetical protein
MPAGDLAPQAADPAAKKMMRVKKAYGFAVLIMAWLLAGMITHRNGIDKASWHRLE